MAAAASWAGAREEKEGQTEVAEEAGAPKARVVRPAAPGASEARAAEADGAAAFSVQGSAVAQTAALTAAREAVKEEPRGLAVRRVAGGAKGVKEQMEGAWRVARGAAAWVEEAMANIDSDRYPRQARVEAATAEVAAVVVQVGVSREVVA